MKNRDENKNTITHRKIIRDGLTIYKKPKSKYWIARIYIPNGYKYTIRSTKENIVELPSCYQVLDKFYCLSC